METSSSTVSVASVIPANSWRALLQAIRPPTLLAGLGPVLIGISLGIHRNKELDLSSPLIILPALAALLLVVFLQAAANLVNDAKDAEKGIDQGERLGPIRVVQSGLLTAAQVHRAYRILFMLAGLLTGLLFWFRQDVIVLEVALACALAAYLYTAGPFPLAYYAMGEVLACIFFGPVAVMGTAYLLTGIIHWDSAFWGLGSGLIAAAIMSINNLRDRKGDKEAGKHTLSTIFGEDLGRKLPLFLLLGSAMLLAAYGFEYNKIVISAPWALLAMMFIRRRITPRLQGEGMMLNEALKFTALFNLFYALLFSSLVLL